MLTMFRGPHTEPRIRIEQNIMHAATVLREPDRDINKKLSYCWETVRRESMPRVAEMHVEMTPRLK